MATVTMGELKKINLAPEDENEDVSQCISMILNTTRGTVPFMRDFGLSQGYIHRPVSGDENSIAADIADQIEEYEQRADAGNVIFSKDMESGIITCDVPFTLVSEEEEEEDDE